MQSVLGILFIVKRFHSVRHQMSCQIYQKRGCARIKKSTIVRKEICLIHEVNISRKRAGVICHSSYVCRYFTVISIVFSLYDIGRVRSNPSCVIQSVRCQDIVCRAAKSGDSGICHSVSQPHDTGHAQTGTQQNPPGRVYVTKIEKPRGPAFCVFQIHV